jgi:hypothetical protein
MRWYLLLCSIGQLGCAGLVGIDDWQAPLSADPVAPPTDGGAGSAGDPGPGGGGAGGEASGPGAAGGCTRAWAYPAIADVALLPGGDPAYDCAGGAEPTINYGVDSLANVGVGRALIRFQLDDAGLQAVAAGASLVLEVARAPFCDGGCPAKPGLIDVFPARNDWKEGTQSGSGVDGATWCEADAKSDVRWEVGGAGGPTDHGPLAAVTAVGASEPTVIWAMPGFDAAWIDHPHREISFLLTAEDAAVFVVATVDSTAAPAPLLRVSGCSD